MGSLTGQTPASDYGGLLNVNAGNIVGLTNVLQQVTDGYNSPTPLQLSTIALNIIRSGYTFQLDGVAVTAQAVDINSMCQPNPIALGLSYFTFPRGTTADRPGSPVNGMMRYNTDTAIFEVYEGGAWEMVATSGSAVFSVSGTPHRITITGTPSNPIVDIASDYVGQTSITTLGTIGTGVWQGTAVSETHGGTNQTTYTLGDTLYSSAANTLSKLAGNITAGIQYLSQTGTGAVSAAPVWATISGGDITGAALTKTDDTNVTMILGGTPATALLRAASMTLGWTGTLSTTRGGSGVSAPTAHGVLIAEGASAFTPIVLGAGQVLIGTTASDPVAGAIGSGSGILVGNASGAITVSNTGVLSNVATANQTTVSGATGNVTIGLASNAVLPGTGGVTLPTGNTAARAGGAGTIRFNSQTSVFESTVDGSTWLTINTAGGTVTSVSGTTNRITSTGGTTPVIDIAATYVGQTSITTLGTIGTGTWQGTAVAEIYGGTNQTTYALGDTLYASAANTLHKLSGNITSGIQYLAQTGTGAVSAAPVWTSISGGDITGAALTKTDDTNVTLTLSGTPTTALLRAAGIAAGWTGTLSGTRGGTGVNNGASTITLGGSLTTSGAFASTFTMTNTTTVTFPTSGTLATTSQIPTGAALTKTDDTNVTLSLGGSPTTALVNAASLTLGWTGQLGLTRGGTNASLTASNGGIVYSTASALAILAGTATAGQMLQSGASTTPAWSTTTYPATNAINTLLYASSANVMAALATANSAVLVTGSTGIPVMSSTMTNGQIIIGSTGATPVAASLTAGSNITITPGAGTITIAATAGGTGTVTSVATAGLATGGTITTTGTITVTAAVKSDQQTATSTSVAVVPGVQQYHPSACQAWVYCDSNGTRNANYNVSSVTKDSTGRLHTSFTTSFSSANYQISTSVYWNQAGSCVVDATVGTPIAAGTFYSLNITAGNAVADPNEYFFACHGAQ